MNILVVDDDRFANTLVHFILSKEGHEVETAEDPMAAMKILEEGEPDLLLLDVMMPYMNGFEFAEKLREEGRKISIIFVTARDTIEDKLRGFNLGADDYICKPYNHQELVARVEVVRRKLNSNFAEDSTPIRCGKFELFPKQLKLVLPDNIVVLTYTETQILRVLMTAPGKVISRDKLLTEVWSYSENSSNIVDVYIRRLRVKLEADADHPQYLLSLRGQGYTFNCHSKI